MRKRLFILSMAVTMMIFISSPSFCQTVARYDSPSHGSDHARAIATDSSGNVYVTGSSATIAYNINLNKLWVKDLCSGKAIVTDSFGKVYVLSGGDFFYTEAFNSKGARLWTQSYAVTSDNEYLTPVGQAIATDSTGNIYVTGCIEDHWSGGSKYLTVARNSRGNLLWAREYGDYDEYGEAVAIATDSTGNVYVTGKSNNDYVTVAYNSSGRQLWVRKYNGKANGIDEATDIATDASGNIYVTGVSGGKNGTDYLTVAYSSRGKQLWVRRYNDPKNGDDDAYAIATDSSGHIYVTGSSYSSGSPPDHNYDYATIAYNSRGKQLWVRRYSGPGNGFDYASDIAVDSAGHIYVTGSIDVSEDDTDCATIAYNSLGKQLWVKRYDGPAKNSWNEARAMAIGSSGHVYVTGDSLGRNSSTDYDYVTVKY